MKIKRIKGYIAKNWLWISVGLVLTGISVEMAYAERGYIACGGEWLTLPLVLMLVDTARTMKKFFSGN